jgi:hypothetical protein
MVHNKRPNRLSTAAWLIAPAVLSVISQFAALAFFARSGGAQRALDFQTMLSLWAWTLVGAFGLDRAARAFAIDPKGFGWYAQLWRLRLAMLCAALAGIGAWMGSSEPEGLMAWAAFGLCVGLCSMGFSAREWMLARGEAVSVSKAQSCAFLGAGFGMALLAVAGAPLEWIALCWFAPHAAIWMGLCAKWGLFTEKPNASELDGKKKGFWGAGYGSFGFQSMGHVALCSLDVVMVKAWLGPHDAFVYAIYSRLAFAAFLASTAFGSVFVGRAQKAVGVGWTKEFVACALMHAGFALSSVCVLALAGSWITKLWLGESLELGMASLLMLGLACLARSVAESAMQTISGSVMQGGALAAAAGSALGLALFASVVLTGWASPMSGLAMAWAAPALGFLVWVGSKR